MSHADSARRKTIEGRPALLVIDFQKSTFVDRDTVRALEHMPDYGERMEAARAVVDRARLSGIPVIFVQENLLADGIGLGREFVRGDNEQALQLARDTTVLRAELGRQEGDYEVLKRRYSAFFGTDLHILLNALKTETLIFVGGLTDVCVHYTFVDAHQHDFVCRVVDECVAGSSVEAHGAALRAMAFLQAGSVCSREEMLSAMKPGA